MSNHFKAHFEKNLQWYSFALLLIMTAMMAYLFIMVEAFDTEVARYELRHEETAPRKVVKPVVAPEAEAPEAGVPDPALDPMLFDPALDPALAPPPLP